MFIGPVYARLVTDRFVPSFSVIVGITCCLIGIVISTYTGTFCVAGPIMQALLNDFGMQTAQIANRTAIYAIEPRARNRVNVAFMLATFCGQLMGTAAGNHVYAQGGWIKSGSASVGFVGAALLLAIARGPWEPGWIGWTGGWSLKKKDVSSADGRTTETVFYEAKKEDCNPSPVEDPPSTEKALEELAAEEGHCGKDLNAKDFGLNNGSESPDSSIKE
jgi:hypothetical protein